MEETKSFWTKTADELTMKDQVVITTVFAAIAAAPWLMIAGAAYISDRRAAKAEKKRIAREDYIDVTPI